LAGIDGKTMQVYSGFEPVAPKGWRRFSTNEVTRTYRTNARQAAYLPTGRTWEGWFRTTGLAPVNTSRCFSLRNNPKSSDLVPFETVLETTLTSRRFGKKLSQSDAGIEPAVSL